MFLMVTMKTLESHSLKIYYVHIDSFQKVQVKLKARSSDSRLLVIDPSRRVHSLDREARSEHRAITGKTVHVILLAH